MLGGAGFLPSTVWKTISLKEIRHLSSRQRIPPTKPHAAKKHQHPEQPGEAPQDETCRRFSITCQAHRGVEGFFKESNALRNDVRNEPTWEGKFRKKHMMIFFGGYPEKKGGVGWCFKVNFLGFFSRWFWAVHVFWVHTHTKMYQLWVTLLGNMIENI